MQIQKFLFLIVFSFTIINSCQKPQKVMMVSTGSPGAILSNSAIVTGRIVDLGEGVTQYGHCYGENQGVDISDLRTNFGAALKAGEFESELTGLRTNTKYFVKAYLSNGKETVYGNEIEFTTPLPVVPEVFTGSITNITQTTADGGGNVTGDGGAPVTSRGICWNTTGNPTISNSKTSDGSGTGSFTSNITGLQPCVIYHVRAYATNNAGTGYGNEISFTTAGNIPTVTTAAVTGITRTTAISGGNITSGGCISITVRGVCWSTSTNPTIAGAHTTDGSGTGSFTSNITGLIPNTNYYVRTYATHNQGTTYGNQVQFKTLAISVPALTTNAVTSVTPTTAVSGGNITDDGGGTITARGVCWSTSANPTISNPHTTNGTGTGSFTSNITGLQPCITYHVRAYATNSVGTAYGNDILFTTAGNIPTVTTAAVTGITRTTAISGGNITSDACISITARGVCWSTSANPTVAGSHSTDGSGTGSFTSSITGLTPNTNYYVRAYATYSQGTVYGNSVSFTTPPITTATLTTNSVTSITSTSAVSGGNITDDGGGTITARGVCWSTSANPTISNPHTSNGTGAGSFTSNITGLTSGTTYYVRAYAANSAGTAYGNQHSFITPVTDVEGNVYKTVVIGTQVWMAENLKTTKYNDGITIPHVTDNAAWASLTTPGYCWYNNDAATYKATYGALYNWYTVNTGILCPMGWHVPSDNEWKELEMHLGMSRNEADLIDWRGGDEGGKLKETSTSHWFNPNTGATNESGFTALPGGDRYGIDGTFHDIGNYAGFWSITQYSTGDAWNRNLYYGNSMVYRGIYWKTVGFSVRCLKN